MAVRWVEQKLLPSRQVLLRTEVGNIVEEESLSNYKHKLFLGFLRVIPMLLAGLYLMNTVLSTFDIEYRVFSYLASTGIIPWLFIMGASYIFHFCEHHRMFLWYILANNIICWIDEEVGISISNWNYFLLHIIVAGVFLFLVLYFHQKCRKKLK